MQLIFDTEATVDIKEKMTSLETSSEISLNDGIESLKTAISNGNKENIQCKENIIKNTEDVTNGIDKDDISDEIEAPLLNDDKAIQNIEKLPTEECQDNCKDVKTNGTTSIGENYSQDTDHIEKDKEGTLDSSTLKKDKNESNDSNQLDTADMEIEHNLESNKDNALKVDENSKTESNNIENILEKIDDVEEEGQTDTEDTEINKTKISGEKSSETVDQPLTAISSLICEKDNIQTDVTENIEEDKDLIETEMDVTNTSEVETENPISVQGDDITDSSKINEENQVETVMEVDVSQPELSISESETLNDNDMETSDIIEKDDQTTLAVTEEEIVKNTSQICKVSDLIHDASSLEEKAIVNSSSIDKGLELESTPSVEKENDVDTESQTVIDEVDHVVIKNYSSVIHAEIEKTSNNDLVKEGTLTIDEDIVLENSSTSNKEEILEQTFSKETDNIVNKRSTADLQDVKEIESVNGQTNTIREEVVKLPETVEPKKKLFSKLSNTLDILSDDEDDAPDATSNENETSKPLEKQCINIEDDDDIMLIDEDVASKNCSSKPTPPQKTDILPEKEDEEKCADSTIDLEKNIENVESGKTDEPLAVETKAVPSPEKETTLNIEEATEEKPKDSIPEKVTIDKPLLPENFLKAYKKNLAEMTREDLEEFCILKIVESIVDRSNLSDIKTKLKEMAQNIEEHKKKALMLTKQNRDLQVVVKSVQEEQKKFADNPAVIKPLKITRSVGMQVLMTEKPGMRKKTTAVTNNINTTNNRNPRPQNQSSKLQKSPAVTQTIPVPRLVPANNPVSKISTPTIQSTTTTQAKTPSPAPNGVRNSPPVQKTAEKRPISRVQSVTVDLTDDEPPTKITPRSSPAPPVRLVSPQNLLAARPPFGQTLNSPRKVYIPISGPQNPNIRSGQAIMLKSVAAGGPGLRPRVPPPHIARMPQNTIRMQARGQSRHPAPLPDAVKQYQPPNWKALPPAPDLKLSKVENGIVISWKIEGYQEDSYEEIASYQLYAYQETSSPPSTALWKKIGDVKALPLPMACTLTHVMAGFKYYFAVRAVDIRSRLGPFSLPGSILLLNKL